MTNNGVRGKCAQNSGNCLFLEQTATTDGLTPLMPCLPHRPVEKYAIFGPSPEIYKEIGSYFRIVARYIGSLSLPLGGGPVRFARLNVVLGVIQPLQRQRRVTGDISHP